MAGNGPSRPVTPRRRRCRIRVRWGRPPPRRRPRSSRPGCSRPSRFPRRRWPSRRSTSAPTARRRSGR
ncbi:hypothetical protein BRD02_12180 [Halobacteriales archaeon QS_8_69_73]|nr:MAG: hypothetical protein BRD02_12180 [Halobacteriales archaeon QS_8_69_73]